MDDLVTWLRGQLDEDEQILRRATGGPWYEDGMTVRGKTHMNDTDVLVIRHTWPQEAAHIIRWDPARVLREVEAKRRRLDYLAGMKHDMGTEDFVTYDSCRALAQPGELGNLEVGYCSCGLDALRDRLYKIEALPYADRPGYREEWRP